jgi:putative phosphoesterase
MFSQDRDSQKIRIKDSIQIIFLYMKVGIISDTHDDIENVQRAIEIFNAERIEYVIHAGDYVLPGIIKEFEKLNAKLIGVLGNNDGEKVHLLKNFLDIGGELKGELGEIKLNGLEFGIYHGTAKEVKDLLVNSRKYDVLICGHTHKTELPPVTPKEQQLGSNGKRLTTLVLNPGTAHKKIESVSGAFTEGGIIIFDTQTREYRFIDLP